MMAVVETTGVGQRRKLRFETLDAILLDAQRLAAGAPVVTLGKWSVGQNFSHVAIMMTRSIDGFPAQMPWAVRFVVRMLLKRRILNKPMAAGFKAPAKAGIVPQAATLEEGLAALRTAVGRLKVEKKRAASPILGKLTAEEWDRLHCRHAELHFSFLLPAATMRH